MPALLALAHPKEPAVSRLGSPKEIRGETQGIVSVLRVEDTKQTLRIFGTYDWVEDNGRENMPKWIEEAAEIAKR